MKYLIAAVILAAISVPLIMIIPNMTLFVFGWIMAAVAIVLLFVFIGSMIEVKLRKKSSAWRLFAISDIVLIIVLIVIALIFNHIDNIFSKGLGNGLLSGVLLLYGLPILVGILIVEYFLWRIVGMMKENTEAEEHHHHDEHCTCEECTHDREEEQ